MLGFFGPDMTTVGQVLLRGRLPVVPLWLAVVLFAALAVAIWKAPEPYRFGLVWIVVTDAADRVPGAPGVALHLRSAGRPR